MTTIATVAAEARSTYAITLAFLDEDGVAVSPSQIRWSLRDEDNAVINNRNNEVVTPASTVKIVLYGNDLALSDLDNESENRRLVVSCKYNSDLGTGLPLVGVYEFKVLNTYANSFLLTSVSASASASPST